MEAIQRYFMGFATENEWLRELNLQKSPISAIGSIRTHVAQCQLCPDPFSLSGKTTNPAFSSPRSFAAMEQNPPNCWTSSLPSKHYWKHWLLAIRFPHCCNCSHRPKQTGVRNKRRFGAAKINRGRKIFCLAIFPRGRNYERFFESDGFFSIFYHMQMSGNPVRIGDGYATVTGYKLPRPLVHQTGKAGVRFQARSQDTGLAVLVVVCDAVQPLRIILSGNIVLRQLLRQREG